MAEFYKGYKKDNVQQQFKVQQGPDISQAMRNIDQDKQDQLSNIKADADTRAGTINALTAVGSGILKTYDSFKQKQAVERGKAEAEMDLLDPTRSKNTSSASMFDWAGDAQKSAYNNLRTQTELADMPQVIEQMMFNDPEVTGGKNPDDMSVQEREAGYLKARDKFMKGRGITGSGYEKEATEYARKLGEAQLPQLHKKAYDTKIAKATSMAGILASKIVNNVENASEVGDLLDTIKGDLGDSAKMTDEEALAMKSFNNSTDLDAALLTGLTEQVIANPESNLKVVEYLKSKEAKEKYGHIKGFQDSVKRVDQFAGQAITAERKARTDLTIEGYYKGLNDGSFNSPSSVRNYLMRENGLSEQQKNEMLIKATKQLQVKQAAYDFTGQYKKGETGIINAQTKDVRDGIFTQMVGDPNQFNLNQGLVPNTAADALVEHLNNGFSAPDQVTKSFEAKTTNIDTLTKQLENLRAFKAKGLSDMTALVPKNAIPRLEYFAGMMAEGKKPEEIKLALGQYDNFVNGIGGADVYSNIDKILKDNSGFEDKIKYAAKEGGTGFDQLQPLFTTSDMSDSMSRASLKYGKDEIKRTFSNYIYMGMEPDKAMELATDEFKNSNQWEEFGKTKAYIPKYYNTNAENLKGFISEKGQENYSDAVSTRMRTKGLDPKDPKMKEEYLNNRISVQPAADYSITRKLEVIDAGEPTGIYIEKQDLDVFTPQRAELQRQKLINTNSDKVKSYNDKLSREREAFTKTVNTVRNIFK